MGVITVSHPSRTAMRIPSPPNWPVGFGFHFFMVIRFHELAERIQRSRHPGGRAVNQFFLVDLFHILLTDVLEDVHHQFNLLIGIVRRRNEPEIRIAVTPNPTAKHCQLKRIDFS
jgi:hypothetical protein